MFSKPGGTIFDLKSAENSGIQYAEKLKASSIDELREKDAEELMKSQGRWGIVIDNYVVLPACEAFESGKFNDVPLISGWNANDGVSSGTKVTAENFRRNAEKQYGDMAEEFLKYFPVGNDQEAGHSQELTGVLSFGWQNCFWSRMQTLKGNNKAYLYYFTRVPPGEPNYGAFHSAEFGYALKTLKPWNRPFTQTDYDLSEKMASYWVSFASKGNPNGDDLPEWPAFSIANPRVIEFSERVEAKPLPFRKQLEFFHRF